MGCVALVSAAGRAGLVITLRCRDVEFGYSDRLIINGLSLEVASGETMALLGLSGSGKTTLLSLIAGFETISSGTIELNGRRVSSVERTTAPDRRSIGMVFQNNALWPHLSVVETVAYPLRRNGLSRSEAGREAVTLLKSLEIEALADRPVDSLSGGQQQRVGVARALARRPELFLFDEPTAHLDAPIRATLQEEVAAYRREAGAAAVYATHDAGEALAIADRVSLIRDGRIVQTGSPDEVYRQPADLEAALLTGPAATVEVRVVGPDTVDIGGVAVTIDGSLPASERVTLLIRPEWATLGGPLAGNVLGRSFRGAHTDYRLETPTGIVIARHPGPPVAEPGESCEWELHRGWPLPELS